MQILEFKIVSFGGSDVWDFAAADAFKIDTKTYKYILTPISILLPCAFPWLAAHLESGLSEYESLSGG